MVYATIIVIATSKLYKNQTKIPICIFKRTQRKQRSCCMKNVRAKMKVRLEMFSSRILQTTGML